MSLKDEILGEMILADNNGSIHSSNYGKLTEIILSLVEKQIDERIESWQDEKRCYMAKKMFVQKNKIRGRIEAYKDIKKMLLK